MPVRPATALAGSGVGLATREPGVVYPGQGLTPPDLIRGINNASGFGVSEAKAARVNLGITHDRITAKLPTDDWTADLQNCHDAGMTPLPVLNSYESWTTFNKATFASQCATWIGTYGPNGSYWVGKRQDLKPTWIEVFNEAYLAHTGDANPNPVAYADAYKQAVVAMRAVDPSAKFIISMAPDIFDGTSWGQWINQMLAGTPDLANYIDAAAIHPYGALDTPGVHDLGGGWQLIPYMRDGLMAAGISAPLWITEVGVNITTGSGETETTQDSTWMARYLNDIPAVFGYVKAFFYFGLHDYGGGGPPQSQAWGLRRDDGTWRPAARRYRNANLRAGGEALPTDSSDAFSVGGLALKTTPAISGASAALSAATLSLTAPTKIPAAASAASSADTLALTAPSLITATTATFGANTLTITAGNQLPLGATTGVSSDSLAITAATKLVLSTDASSADTLSLKAPTFLLLGSSSAAAADTLALRAPTLVGLQPSAASSADTLSLYTLIVLPLQPSAGHSAATLVLAVPALPVDVVAIDQAVTSAFGSPSVFTLLGVSNLAATDAAAANLSATPLEPLIQSATEAIQSNSAVADVTLRDES